MSKSGPGQSLLIAVVCLAIVALLLGSGFWPQAGPAFPTVFAQGIEPTPTADPLDIPELPANPTQVDIGRVSYYYNCMPCHGDHGQGLTEAWRMTWVEDHRNCWNRGCHAGRPGDEGFPLPDVIPALAGPSANLNRFASAEDLRQFLGDTHPPQRPGALPEEEYWALTAFLLAENGRLPSGTELGPVADQAGLNLSLIAAVIAGIVAVGLAVLIYRRRPGMKR